MVIFSNWTHDIRGIHNSYWRSNCRITYSGAMKIIKIIPWLLLRLSHQTLLRTRHRRLSLFLKHHFSILSFYNIFPKVLLFYNFDFFFIWWWLSKLTKADSMFAVRCDLLFDQRTRALIFPIGHCGVWTEYYLHDGRACDVWSRLFWRSWSVNH